MAQENHKNTADPCQPTDGIDKEATTVSESKSKILLWLVDY